MDGLSFNLKAVDGLKPQALWKHFAHIASIPRPSGQEEAVLNYVKQVALRHRCEVKRDQVGNMLVVKPGRERQLTPLAFQGHVDMVCEKNSSHPHRFSEDPIKLTTRSDRPGWLYGDGTTLGADNGIGIATMLALVEHPQQTRRDLEFLFTVDEETGLTGAQGLEGGWLKSKTLLNLDTEEEGVLYVGCAGGLDLDAQWSLKRETQNLGSGFYVVLDVKNLRGGHSGIDIDKQRANALKILAHSLSSLLDDYQGKLRAVSLQGGKARNAIPREAWALLWLGTDEPISLAQRHLNEKMDNLRGIWTGIFRSTDPDLVLQASVVDPKDSLAPQGLEKKYGSEVVGMLKWKPIEAGLFTRWLQGLMSFASQPYRFELAIPGLVRSSSNWGVLQTDPEKLVVRTKLRGSYEPELHVLKEELTALLTLAGGVVATGGGYCGWQPDLASPLLAQAQRVHERLFGHKASVKAVHAGLECGLIGSKYPEMQMISFGPDIQNAHSPDECVEVHSVGRFWDYVEAFVADLDQKLS